MAKTTNIISVRDLDFTYHGSDTHAVRGVEFAVQPGEIFGFLGPSGAGKSTVQKILIGLLRGYRGTVEVRGRPIDAWGPELYEKVGVLFEFPNHFLKLTALENLQHFARLYAGRTRNPEELLQLVDLSEAADRRVGQFSKGMKTRLGVARALLNEPELLFMDEPTAGLDPVNADRIKSLIREQRAAGRTLFLTTHDMTVADQLCDRVAFIDGGRIKVTDAPRALKLQHGQPRVRVEFRTDEGLHSREFALEGIGANQEFIEVLSSRKVETIHTLEATLAEVFVKVTGTRLQS